MAENITAGTAEYVAPDTATIGGKYTEMRKYDKSNRIIFKDAKKYPIVPAIMSQLGGGVGTVTANEFFIWEDEDEALQFTPATASTDVDGTEDGFVLANADARQWKVGDVGIIDGLWYPGTGSDSSTTPAGDRPAQERFLVKSIGAEGADNTTLTVVRQSNTEVTTSMTLLKAGSAQPDGWTAGSGFSIEPISRYQYVQNFSRVWEVDENRANEDAWGMDDMKRLDRMKRQSFNRELAYYTWWGRRGKQTLGGGKERRFFGGLIEDIPSSNFTRLNGPITLRWMRYQATTWSSRGSDTKYAFVGPTAAGYLDVKLEDNLRINDQLSQQIGIPSVKEIELGPLKLRLIVDESFRGTQLHDGMVLVDLPYQKLKYLQGMAPNVLVKDIKDAKNRQHDMIHTTKKELYAAATLWRTFPESNHIVYDITG